MRLKLLFLLTISLFFSACQKGKLSEENQFKALSLQDKTLTDYDSSGIRFHFSGELDKSKFASLDRISFYYTEDCSGQPMGSESVAQFESQGVNVQAPHGNSVKIYYSSDSSTECLFLEEYVYPSLAPQDPSFVEAVPPSPTRISLTPGIFGQAFPPSAAVEFYTEATCDNRIASGVARDFNPVGIVVPVVANATTNIYARVRDYNNTYSNCVHMIDYEHSNALSPSPQLVSITPPSPSKTSFTPFIVGTVDVNADTVALYNDSGCLNELASGTPAVFTSTGFQITAEENGEIEIYAKSIGTDGAPSACNRLSNFIHDDEGPVDPTYSNISPSSPANLNNLGGQVRITGSSSADTASLAFFSDFVCLSPLGSGSKEDFEGPGIAVGLPVDTLTDIYARAFDSAGNSSNCISFTNFNYNTRPPEQPTFGSFDPPSPTNLSTTPLIKGTVAARTVQLDFYRDENCANPIGSGSRSTFEGAGIQITAQANTTTDIYTRVSDLEGNVSSCFSLASFSHSNQQASDPSFFTSFPQSPSRTSFTPLIIGTADNSIQTVTLYSDVGCFSQIGTGTRGEFTSSGISVNLQQNHSSTIYARATDTFGNPSNCVNLTTYIHTNEPPSNPILTSVTPLSPNNSSFTPTLVGQALQNPASQLAPNEISFYDSSSCISKLGEGTPAEYSGAGIQLTVPQDTPSQVYARSFDAAGNKSDCTFLTNYTHNSLIPAEPRYLSSTPASPTFSQDVRISGSWRPSSDFMNRVNLSFFTDSNCSNLVTSGDPSSLTTTGFPLTLPQAALTSLYARSTNEVGTSSACVSMATLRHYEEAPSNFLASLQSDGSVILSWNPDNISQAPLAYTVERSTQSGGPYSVVSAAQAGTSYRDYFVRQGTTYYYRVYTTNSTGRSLYSTEVNISIAPPPASSIANLSATAQDTQAQLLWSGFPENMNYKIYRAATYGGPFLDLGVKTTLTSYTDSLLTNNQAYYYVVKATNPSGLSMQSNMASVVPKPTPPVITNFSFEPQRDSAECGGGLAFRAAWNPAPYANSYSVRRNGGSIANVSDTTYLNCNPGTGNLYYYRVSANWGTSGSGSNSNSVGFYSTMGVSLTADPGQNEILLNWSSPSSLPQDIQPFATHYDVYVSEDADKNFIPLVSNVTSKNYTHAVSNGETRHYYVQAYLTDGSGRRVYIGYPSTLVSAKTNAPSVSPSNLTLAKNPATGGPQLTWTSPTHFNTFKVYRAMALGGPYTLLTETTSTTVSSLGLLEGVNYFKVRSTWGSLETADSNIVSYRHAPISNFNIITSATDISLTWDVIAGVQDYEVFRAESESGPYISLAIAPANSHTDATALAGENYFYKVRARFTDATVGEDSVVLKGSRTGVSTPDAPSLTLVNSTFINVAWTPVTGAVQYQVHYAQNLAGPYILRGSYVGTEAGLSGMQPGQEYFIRVTAVEVGGSTHPSAPSSIYTYGIPNPPLPTSGDNQVTLSWTAVQDALNYDILRSSDDVTYTPVATNFAGTSYTDATASNGNIYFYKILAHFPSGINQTSVRSFSVSPGVMPLTPGGLSVENNGVGTEVDLTWSLSSGATRYNVYRSTTSGSYGAPVRNSTTTYKINVTGLTLGTRYYFRVTALKGDVESAPSNEVSIVAQAYPPAPLARYQSNTEAIITWAAVGGASSYNLYRSETGVHFEEIATGLATGSFVDTTLDPNKTYFYKYMSYDASSTEMAYSLLSQGVSLSIVPETVIGLEVLAVTTSSVEISWPRVPSILNYEILRSSTAGGPYTTIASPNALTTNYTDNTVVAGQSYYYVMRTLSPSGRPSPNSAEKSVNLVTGPTALAASDGGGQVNVSWTASAGVTDYVIARSEQAGGPYGQVGVSAVTSFSDTNVLSGKTYYYIVYGRYADGRLSVKSNEVFSAVAGFINLRVPIELTDAPLSSSSSLALTFDRAQVSYDPDAYDGVVGTDLVVIASNSDSSPRTIELLDGANAVVATVNVPANTAQATRFVTGASLLPASSTYKLRLAQTTSDFELRVLKAKISVSQVGASKTKLYYPLLSSEAASNIVDQSIFETNMESFQEITNAMHYIRDSSKLSEIVEYNAWTLESLVSATGSAKGSLALQNENTVQFVEGSETVFTGSSIQMAKTEIDEGGANFEDSNNGNTYSLKLRCVFDCSSGVVKVYKAGLWVELQHLTKAQVIERLNLLHLSISSGLNLSSERLELSSTAYSNPVFRYQVQADEDSSSAADFSLVQHADESGEAGILDVIGTILTADTDHFEVYHTAPFNVIDGQKYMTKATPNSGSTDLKSSQILIDISN